jgi:hypothetical protein
MIIHEHLRPRPLDLRVAHYFLGVVGPDFSSWTKQPVSLHSFNCLRVCLSVDAERLADAKTVTPA